jgi:hypothetical protein
MKGSAMTQAELERELAAATGETVSLIRQRGFQLVEPPVIDWDVMYPIEQARRVQRPARRLRIAA